MLPTKALTKMIQLTWNNPKANSQMSIVDILGSFENHFDLFKPK